MTNNTAHDEESFAKPRRSLRHRVAEVPSLYRFGAKRSDHQKDPL